MSTLSSRPSVKLRDAAQLGDLHRIAGQLMAAEARPVTLWEVIARLVDRWRESEPAREGR